MSTKINPIPQVRVPVQAGDATPSLGVTLYPLVATLDYSCLYWQGPPTCGRATHRGVRLEVERGGAVHHVKKPRNIYAPFQGNRLPDPSTPTDNNSVTASSPSNPLDRGRNISNISIFRFSSIYGGASDARSSRSNTLCALRSNSRLQSVGLAIPGRGWFFSLNPSGCISPCYKSV